MQFAFCRISLIFADFRENYDPDNDKVLIKVTLYFYIFSYCYSFRKKFDKNRLRSKKNLGRKITLKFPFISPLCPPRPAMSAPNEC